VKNHSYSQA